MADQKIENLLNLALDATEEEREKSESLEVGYDERQRTWEVIVRYSGNLLEYIPEHWGAVLLSGGYAILTLPQSEIDNLATLPQIEYVEKPKRLYFEVDAGRTASCISAVQTPQHNLKGDGVLVAVIDSGVDYFHPDFRNEDGSTRILALWDQTGVPAAGSADNMSEDMNNSGSIERQADGAGDGQDRSLAEASPAGSLSEQISPERNLVERMSPAGRPPRGFLQGIEYTKAEIDQALSAGSREAGYRIVPQQDVSGHGTEVLGIAAGNGRASGGRYRGVAPESELLIVKLSAVQEGGFPRTTEMMQALEYVMGKANELGRPVAVNLSFGNVYGSHRGNSLLESYIDLMADRGRNVIAVGTGNEGSAAGHASGQVVMGQPEEIQFLVDDFETALNLQLWKNYVDEYSITMIHPDGRIIGPFSRELGTARYQLGNQTLLVYYGEPSPYQENQEIFIDFIPNETYLDSGIWRLVLTPVRIVTGDYNLWMIDSRARGSGTRFLSPSVDTTMTIPSTAAKVIAVGAYDARLNSYAAFSGRGWPDQTYQLRPDLVAPGVEITTTAPGGGYTSVTGTSFATPFVTGAAALMMQWGIVNGNDPYLYGEKVRAYLRRGARQLPGFEVWPNNVMGYGALCVRDSLPF